MTKIQNIPNTNLAVKSGEIDHLFEVIDVRGETLMTVTLMPYYPKGREFGVWERKGEFVEGTGATRLKGREKWETPMKTFALADWRVALNFAVNQAALIAA